MRRRFLILLALALILSAAAAPAAAALDPPWDGNPISHGLGPTYGEMWAGPSFAHESVVNYQDAPLALIPYGSIKPTLDQFVLEAAEAGVPERMTYTVFGKSSGGRDLYAVVINAVETSAQRRDYARWQNIRAIELTDPARAKAMLASYGDDVKIPIYIETGIDASEYEGTDAMMQAIRDLMVTPRGANPTIDNFLDHAIIVVNVCMGPDGRVYGDDENELGIDMNRDLLVQSQPETKATVKLEQQYLAVAGLDMHGYHDVTLMEGLTMPHNPGLDYDIFAYWNQRRTAVNKTDFAAIGQGIDIPVNDWGPAGAGSAPAGPEYAQGWDDWPVCYGQSYIALLGVDGSTVEMPSDRMLAKTIQYLSFYSSAEFWVDNRQAMLEAQLERFRRGVDNDPRDSSAIESVPLLADLGWSDEIHNWTVDYPKAFVIPFGDGQRSNAEANRLVEWLFRNGIKVTCMSEDFTWGSTAYEAGSYVVWMNQAMRGLAWNALAAGVDIQERITRLYSPPAAWSHGLAWGADTVEVARDDATFNPATYQAFAVNDLQGGVRDGIDAPSSWYSATLKGVRECQALIALLRDGVRGEMAEHSFVSTTGGSMPAGTLIFPGDDVTAAKLDSAGRQAGLWFERNVGVTKPPTTVVPDVPKIAILVDELLPSRVVPLTGSKSVSVTSRVGVNEASRLAEEPKAGGGPATSVGASGREILTMRETDGVMKVLFGEAKWVPTIVGANSLQNAPTDPLLGYDVVYNAYAPYPTEENATARARLDAFFARGGGYIGTAQATRAIQFLNDASLLTGTLSLGTQTAFGGISKWDNLGASDSPITGAYPSSDYVFLPQHITYFTSTPTNAVIDGRLPSSVATFGGENGFVAGMWMTRLPEANSAPIFIHGTTPVGSRYFASGVNLVTRMDPERVWPFIVMAALWSDQVDEDEVAFTISASTGLNGTITPSGDVSVAIGNAQTYTITPNYGYEIVDVVVDGVSVGAVSSYTFDNVAAEHTISATFAAVTAVPWKITLSLSKAVVRVNTKVRFYGSVTSEGTPATGTAKIQRKKSGGSWANWRTVTLSTSGKYSTTVKMIKRGTWYFRTMKASDAAHLTSYSRLLKLRVR